MRLRSLICLLLALGAATSMAQSHYDIREPVVSRDDATVSRVASDALAALLKRLSGDDSIASAAGVAEAIADARSRLALYSFEETAEGLFLQGRFQAEVVKNILRDARASYWAQLRPPLLVWLAVDEPGGRRLASRITESDLYQALHQRMASVGLELRQPLLDLDDIASVSTDIVWHRELAPLIEASTRYQSEHLLLGRLVYLSGGERWIHWVYRSPRATWEYQQSATDADSLVTGLVDLVARDMRSQFAVRLEPLRQQERVLRFSVAGIADWGDYQAVTAIIAAIPLVEHWRVSQIEGDTVELQVKGIDDIAALIKLLPVASGLQAAVESETAEVAFHWARP